MSSNVSSLSSRSSKYSSLSFINVSSYKSEINSCLSFSNLKLLNGSISFNSSNSEASVNILFRICGSKSKLKIIIQT